jgi:hypothetical protein
MVSPSSLKIRSHVPPTSRASSFTEPGADAVNTVLVQAGLSDEAG